jgi:UDP-2,3-diacylglucosamine hydrolase
MGEEREPLILYTKRYIQYHSNVDYFIYGHRHIDIDLQLTKKARVIVLGDWISQFSYVVYDGEHLFMSQYIEGESRL